MAQHSAPTVTTRPTAAARRRGPRTALAVVGLTAVAACSSAEVADPATGDDGAGGTAATLDGPAYFIAVHNEPFHSQPGSEEVVAENYVFLTGMVTEADSYGVKLTLMFTAQWADYILADPQRTEQVRGWGAAGHEIAAHHHSIYHGNWDGYTAYSAEHAKKTRLVLGHQPEAYLGTLDDYLAKLWALDPAVRSGCMNDEHDKNALPDGIVYDTCSGFANHGEVGVLESDAVTPNKGINDYTLTGRWNGIERTWLAHYQITREQGTNEAMDTFPELTGGVYGVVLHSSEREADELSRFLTFLHEQDPSAAGSRTVAEVVEQGLLSDQTISEQALAESHQLPGGQGSPCGDGQCDANEQADPTLCPGDCP